MSETSPKLEKDTTGFDFRRSEIREEQITANGIHLTDRRRWTPESVEADYQEQQAAKRADHQKQQEALRAPLSDAEILTASSSLGKMVSAKLEALRGRSKQGSQEITDLDGDSRALFRLTQIFRGETLAWGNDQSNQWKKMSPSERLDDLVDVHARERKVDYQTGLVHSGGYWPTVYYEFARARDYLLTMQGHPAEIRQNVLDDAASATSPDFMSEPLTIDAVELESHREAA